MNARIKNLENITSFLTGIAQMSVSDIQSFFSNSQNILSLQNSIFDFQKEFASFKKQVMDIQSQHKDQQLNLVKEKNAEFINLQNKLSESEKIISNAQLEIAELKRSISMKEAQNALLIAENLSLKNHGISESPSLKKKRDDISSLNSSTNITELDELKKANKTNIELQNTIIKLKRDLEQTKSVSNKYQDLNDPEKATQEIAKLNTEIDKKENLYKNAEFTISELQQQLAKADITLNKTVEKQNKRIMQIMNLLKDHRSKFERKINSENIIIDDKIGYLNDHLIKIKAKLMFNKDLKKENRLLSNQIENAKQLLEFAMESMANLAGVSDENIPSSYDVLENGEMLSIYLSDLQAKVVERSIAEAEIKPKPSKKQQLNSTLDTMNNLMSIMTEQMQNEHEMLMSQISDDKDLPSFRKTVSYQTSYSGE